jgi:hypothetical protein
VRVDKKFCAILSFMHHGISKCSGRVLITLIKGMKFEGELRFD